MCAFVSVRKRYREKDGHGHPVGELGNSASFYFIIRISKSNDKKVGNSGFRSFKMLLSARIVVSGPQIYSRLIFSFFYFFLHDRENRVMLL